MKGSEDTTAISMLAQQAVESSSGRRIVAISARSIVRGHVERRAVVRQLGATIYRSGGRLVLREVAALAAADGDPLGELASHELLSGFWLDREA
jgi:hypothetical protein